MRSPHFFLKAATVSSFLLLLSGFVAYRSGYFDRYLYSTNGGNSLSNMQQSDYAVADTGTKPVDSMQNRTLMSSSKSIVIADAAPVKNLPFTDTGTLRVFIADSIRLKYEKELEKERVYMMSSKSGYVVSASHPSRTRYPVSINGKLQFLTAPQIDSLIKLKPIIDIMKTIPDTATKEPVRIFSTKSGSILRSSDIKKANKKAKKTKPITF
jgi:hypothetical protein